MSSHSPEQKKEINSNIIENNVADFLHLISIIKVVSKDFFDNLKLTYHNLNNSILPATIEKMAEFSVLNESFRKSVTDHYAALQNPEKQSLLKSHHPDYMMGFFAKEKVEKPSLEAAFEKKVQSIFQKNVKTLSILQRDAMIMHHFLSPSLTVHKTHGKITESMIHELKNSDFKHAHHPDAILIFENHDLIQADQVAKIYHALSSLKSPVRKIFILGNGDNPENDMLIKRLIELGIPENIIVSESQAENLSQAIVTIDSLMQAENVAFPHIIISGNPAKIFRELRSYEIQSTHDWHRITSLPPTLDAIKQLYYSNQADCTLHIMSALREIATFLEYTLNTDFLSPRSPPSRATLSENIQLLIDYYTMLTKQSLNKAAIVNNFLAFSHSKAEGKPDDKLKMQLTNDIRSMCDYFRVAHHLLEIQQKKQVTEQIQMKKSMP